MCLFCLEVCYGEGKLVFHAVDYIISDYKIEPVYLQMLVQMMHSALFGRVQLNCFQSTLDFRTSGIMQYGRNF